MRKIIPSVFTLLLFPCLLCAQPSFKVMTEELPPFNFIKDGETVGISTDVVRTVFEQANCSIDGGKIHVYPWTRAYDAVQKAPRTALYSMARTAERENLFKWVGPITNVTLGVIAKKSRNIKISNSGDFKNYRIGTVRDGAPEQLLVQAGADEASLCRLALPEMNIKKLQADRIDLFAFNIQTTHYLMRTLGINPEDYEMVFALKEIDLYLALHKDTDESLVCSLQSGLDEMKHSEGGGANEFERIVGKYLWQGSHADLQSEKDSE